MLDATVSSFRRPVDTSVGSHLRLARHNMNLIAIAPRSEIAHANEKPLTICQRNPASYPAAWSVVTTKPAINKIEFAFEAIGRGKHRYPTVSAANCSNKSGTKRSDGIFCEYSVQEHFRRCSFDRRYDSRVL